MQYTKEYSPMHDQVSSDAPTFWMNVTTSSNWQRSPVGIVRVEQEIRRQLKGMLQGRLRAMFIETASLSPKRLAFKHVNGC